MFTALGGSDDGFIPVRGKQSKRQRISSGGLSGPIDQPDTEDLFEADFFFFTRFEHGPKIVSHIVKIISK